MAILVYLRMAHIPPLWGAGDAGEGLAAPPNPPKALPCVCAPPNPLKPPACWAAAPNPGEPCAARLPKPPAVRPDTLR